MNVQTKININGQDYEAEVEARTLLVHFIRDVVGLKGTKVGCDTSQCGSCTVHMDGVAVKSCTVLAAQAVSGGGSLLSLFLVSSGVDSLRRLLQTGLHPASPSPAYVNGRTQQPWWETGGANLRFAGCHTR